MSLASNLLDEFLQEVETTRRFLQRIPADKFDWRCHEKSHTIGELALHIASVPGNIATMAAKDAGDLPNFGQPWPSARSVKELTDKLDWSIETAKRELPRLTDEQLQQTWHGRQGGATVFSMPRGQFLRSAMMNHWIQHRGQLGVYLRLVGAKVPASYGPSGDE